MVESNLPIVECVINVSIGRDQMLLNKMKNILHHPGYCYMLHMDIGYDANRTVFTIVGVVEPLFEAIGDLVIFLIDHSDIARHSGAHPYLGMLDVIPFIPIKNITTAQLSILVKDFSIELGRKNMLPIYYYGRLSNDVNRKTLAQLRKGGINKIKRCIDSTFPPDAGPDELHPSMGVSCMTVRDFMAAYNINIKARDLKHAKTLSKALIIKRQSKTAALLDTSDVRYMVWYMPTFNSFQLSTNIYNIEAVNLYSLYKYVEQIAKPLDISVHGAELIGMVPLKGVCGDSDSLQDALSYINLNSVKPFDEKQNILEYQLADLVWA